MQNRYVGDLGDFSKLGLLRVLQKTGLSIGVNWYLVPDETHNQDGRFIKYLEDDGYRCCDEALCKELKRIVDSDQRRASELENERILKAIYYSDI